MQFPRVPYVPTFFQQVPAQKCLMTHVDLICVSILPLSQGLTGRPGDAGPQGKVGPSVSAIFAMFSTICCVFVYHLKRIAHVCCLTHYQRSYVLLISQSGRAVSFYQKCSHQVMTHKWFHQIKLQEMYPPIIIHQAHPQRCWCFKLAQLSYFSEGQSLTVQID